MDKTLSAWRKIISIVINKNNHCISKEQQQEICEISRENGFEIEENSKGNFTVWNEDVGIEFFLEKC